jgi:transcriptional regulator with XRE-family HTH domain
MALVPTVVADGPKICELAKAKHGTVKAFADSIGRHPNAITNMHQPRLSVVSVKALTKIAEALGVDISEITLAPKTEQPGNKAA